MIIPPINKGLFFAKTDMQIKNNSIILLTIIASPIKYNVLLKYIQN